MSAESLFQNHIILQLQKFTRAAWGNSTHVLLTYPDSNVEYINLGEYFEAFQRLFPAAVGYDKILVRQEYCDALQALKDNTAYRRGAYITGQPGIGKTIFLIYMLVISLKDKRPVVLELPDGRPFYALFQKSEFTIHSFNDGLAPISDLSGIVWALSDSNYETKRPNPIFLSVPGIIRVIQTTSPREKRWKRWSEEAGASCYIMDLWTPEEIKIVANLLSFDIDRMMLLGKKWGYNPRNLLSFIQKDQTDLQIEEMYRSQAPVAVERGKDMLSSIKQNALFANAPSKFYFCQPKHISETEVNHFISTPLVPTETICKFLGDALQEHDNNVRLAFFRALSQHNETRSAARYIYEYMFHIYFAAGEPIECQWLRPTKKKIAKRDHVIRLTDTSNVTPSTWSALNRNAPFFWVAPKNTPGIDSLLVLEDDIYVFQVTISSSHASPIEGMKKARNYLHFELRNLAWKVVFVGQESAAAEPSAESWANKLFFPRNDMGVSIAWAVVDPVLKSVHFTDFHDTQDLEVEPDDGEEEPAEQEPPLSKGTKRTIKEVAAEPEEALRASTSRTRFGIRKRT